MTCGIYCITNNINGKQYVGQSINIEGRWKQHCTHNQLTIGKAIQKYGESNFSFEILEETPDDQDILNEKEIFWIEKLGTFSFNHYNRTKGGQLGNLPVENIRGDSTRYKISKKNSGENNGMYNKKPTITKNGFVNGKQQYCLRSNGKVIARSHSISKLEYIRDYEDWDNLNNPKVTLIKNGSVNGKQKYSIMYKKVELKTTCNFNKANRLFKLAKSKLGGEDKEYYQKHLEEVIPSRIYISKNPSDLNDVSYCRGGYIPNNHNNIQMSKKLTSTGIYKVTNEKDRFRYTYTDVMGNRRSFCSVNPQKLKEKVLSNNLHWIVLDEKKAGENGLL